MTFKDSATTFQILDLAVIETDAGHARRNISEEQLKGLVNSIRKIGLIHPIVVRPADTPGHYVVVVGERRRQAAILAGEQSIPAVIRSCAPDQLLEVQVFENIGLGVRSALEARDMANAIQSISERFTTPEEAAEHFGRAPTWLNQATAAANLSKKVSALLDSGKISGTGTAVQLEKLSKKNEAKADSLIDQIEQLPEGEKISKKVVDMALADESGRRKKDDLSVAAESSVEASVSASKLPSTSMSTTQVLEAEAVVSNTGSTRNKINPGKVKRVAELLGLGDEDEEEILIRLIDEFLAQKLE